MGQAKAGSEWGRLRGAGMVCLHSAELAANKGRCRGQSGPWH